MFQNTLPATLIFDADTGSFAGYPHRCFTANADRLVAFGCGNPTSSGWIAAIEGVTKRVFTQLGLI